jgi:hypothetical protein
MKVLLFPKVISTKNNHHNNSNSCNSNNSKISVSARSLRCVQSGPPEYTKRCFNSATPLRFVYLAKSRSLIKESYQISRVGRFILIMN